MVRQNVGYPTNFAFFATSHEVVGISDRCDRTGSSSSESGGGVTGTQHAPVESQIERVSSVSAQLAPDRHAELSWHQTDTKPAMQRTGQYKPVTTPIGGRNHPYFRLRERLRACFTCFRCASAEPTRSALGNCTPRRDSTSSEHSILTPSVR